jgi:hypothetical protein
MQPTALKRRLSAAFGYWQTWFVRKSLLALSKTPDTMETD